MADNTLLVDHNILLYTPDILDPQLAHLIKHFCGTARTHLAAPLADASSRVAYLCGDIDALYPPAQAAGFKALYIVEQCSSNLDTLPEHIQRVQLGQVPMNLHGAGVFFRTILPHPSVSDVRAANSEVFRQIEGSHVFRQLTESTKPNFALRTGLYMSHVESIGPLRGQSRRAGGASEPFEVTTGLKTQLLRCSSNFRDGATDNFRDIDHQILAVLNQAAAQSFEQPIQFNHVLAQIYNNGETKKAKIKAHSDKTKDMPRHGLIGFFTLYDEWPELSGFKIKQSTEDPFDFCYKGTSVLTELLFKLKPSVEDESLVKEFSVKLYPNSVFIISLLTNRLYTHEIRPSVLPPQVLPKRMGYVARCSNTTAVYADDGRVLVKEEGREYLEMVPMTSCRLKSLRKSYFDENVGSHLMDYLPTDFSMNQGDYVKPTV